MFPTGDEKDDYLCCPGMVHNLGDVKFALKIGESAGNVTCK